MLSTIEIQDFRCIGHAVLELDERGTGLVGGNAAGKTSLLEAVYFLTHGRSFRTSTRARLIRRGTEYFRVVANIVTPSARLVAGIEHGHGRTQIRLAGKSVSGVSDIAGVLPIQVIDPGVHRLIDEGSARRRRLLDWGVFHVEHGFLHHWRRYQRALAQRNTALREGQDENIIDAWTHELSGSGAIMDEARRAYSSTFQNEFCRLATEFLGDEVQLEYRRGWEQGMTLEAALAGARDKDRRIGTTTTGAHRADLVIKVDGVLARDRVSRGQQKVLAAALILAQIRVLGRLATQTQTCLLLDDPAAELDVDKLGKLLHAIKQTPAQLIVTSVTDTGLRGIEIGRKFHVEQGRFVPVL